MLRVHLGPEDLGRVRFAPAPAPVLEAVLMLFELRHRPRVAGAAANGDGFDWRHHVRSVFPSSARPLFSLVPSRRRALYLDVLTPDPDEAFHLVRNTPPQVHTVNVERITKLKTEPVPMWLRRYADGDAEVLRTLDRALRDFHGACLAPHWSAVTSRFNDDITGRMDVQRRHGVAAMLNTLSPDMRLRGNILEGRYPWDREAFLDGEGLVLMPSYFWTGYPLFTWDPQNQSRHVLIYPARRGRPAINGTRDASTDALAALLGPTRAAVLGELREPRNTTELADRVGISAATASHHTTTLREAGLVTSQRAGRAVQHRLTRLGRSLLGQ